MNGPGRVGFHQALRGLPLHSGKAAQAGDDHGEGSHAWSTSTGSTVAGDPRLAQGEPGPGSDLWEAREGITTPNPDDMHLESAAMSLY